MTVHLNCMIVRSLKTIMPYCYASHNLLQLMAMLFVSISNTKRKSPTSAAKQRLIPIRGFSHGQMMPIQNYHKFKHGFYCLKMCLLSSGLIKAIDHWAFPIPEAIL